MDDSPLAAILTKSTPFLIWLRTSPSIWLVFSVSAPTPEAGAPILLVDDVRVNFPVHVKDGSIFGKTKPLRAVDGVSFALRAGETLGVRHAHG